MGCDTGAGEGGPSGEGTGSAGLSVVDQWRVLTLERLLERRHEIELAVGDTTEVQEQIDSLCSS